MCEADRHRQLGMVGVVIYRKEYVYVKVAVVLTSCCLTGMLIHCYLNF